MKIIIWIALFLCILCAGGKITANFFAEVTAFLSFIFEKDKKRIEGKIVAFVVKRTSSLLAEELNCHFYYEYFIRIIDPNNGRRHNLFISSKVEYLYFLELCRDHNYNESIIFLVKKKISKGMYEAYFLSTVLSKA